MDFIIKRKTLISMLFIGLTLLGYVSYNRLSMELLPATQLPTLLVQVSSAVELDPDYIEKQAVIPVEGAISTLENVEKIESTISNRSGTVTIYYQQGADLKYAYLKLQEKVTLLSSTLPEEFNLNLVRIDLDQVNSMFMDLQVRGSGSADRIRNIADRDITPVLENIDGIAGVEVYGGRESSIEVRLDEEACRANNITMNQVRSLLSSNSRDKVFTGRVIENEKTLYVNVSAEYTDVSQIGNIIVKQDGPVLLKDIAQIFFGVKDETSYSRVNGQEAVTLSLVYDNQANLIDLSHKTLKIINDLNNTLASSDVRIVVQNNNAEIMESNINQIIKLAIVGGLLAVLILWFFLRNLRLVMIIGIAIPVSVYTAFNFFYAAGISINSLTLVGMALAIGMLIDNSVVVLENIYRLAGTGKTPDEAVKQGTREVIRAVIAATITTVVVFIPFIFTDNFLIRILGKNIAVSIISTLLVSLGVALFLIPMATHYLISRTGRSNTEIYKKLSLHNRMIQSYLLILKASMRKPAGTIIGALAIFFAALVISLGSSMNSTDEVETNSFRLNVTMPGGSTLDKTDAVVSDIESRLASIPEKEDVIARVEEGQATVTVNLSEEWEKESDRKLEEIKTDIEDKVHNIREADISMEDISSGGTYSGGGGMSGSNPGDSFSRMLGIGTQSESIIIKGQDFEKMQNLAEDLQYYMEDLSTISRVNLNIQQNRPEVQLLFDTELMSRNNITLGNVSQELGSFTQEYSSGVTFRQGTDEYDIVIKYDKPEEELNQDKTLDDLKKLQVSGTAGNVMEVEELAGIVLSSGPGNIHRENQEKSITLTYSFSQEITDSKPLLESAREEVDDLISGMIIPSGVAVEVVHEENDLAGFLKLFLIAFILIYMILAAVFESFTTPVVLMFSIPLAALGSLIALILTGNSLLNINTLTGLLILLGVVVNNGIILIDYSNILMKRGYRRSRALMMAGLARVRPIIITALTTIVALLPLALGKSEFVSSIGASFAITVIGGLTLSTLLTLVFIPTFYSGLENSLSWLFSQKRIVQVIMAVAFIILVIVSILYINKLIWRIIAIILELILVPASAWFLLTSLKKARETIIPAGDPITIVIRSLVKIYDRDSRFQREWKAGKKIRERSGEETPPKSFGELAQSLWQLPVLGFSLYLTYFYLESGFWIFIFSVITWFLLMMLWSPLSSLISAKAKGKFIKLVHRATDRLIFWAVPFLNLVICQAKWHNIAAVIVVGVLWYTGLVIYSTGQYLNRKSVDIYRLKGKFRNIRKAYFRIVLSIPVIGKTRKPFRALSGVSMEIGQGMFGLLGPNGAGKTTLMRIVCGILEQSYGKIWINGLDANEKREELQGLIGYLPQEFGAYENMTAWEFLQYQAMLKNITDAETRNERVLYVLRSVHMEERMNEKIGSYSGGMKQRIGIAQILLHLPRILVVDEPTAGLDPRERIRFRNLLVELSRERVVIFSTHIIEDISSSCNKVAVLDKGVLRYLGHPSDMAKSAQGHVWQFHLSPEEFRKVSEEKLIVHHMSEKGSIRVRCISEKIPYENAVEVTPNLEDAYLWLLRKSKFK